MNDQKVKEFDEFYVKNYSYLKGFTKSINPAHFYEDTLNDVYIRLRSRIETNGYDGNDYLNYVRCSLMNHYKSAYRTKKNQIFVDIDDQAYYSNIEETLLQNHEQNEQDFQQQQMDTYLTTMVYEFVERYYSPKEVFIFKTYYLLKHKHLNYKQLATATGYSITSVSNTIKKMKKGLREGLSAYIYSGQTIDT